MDSPWVDLSGEAWLQCLLDPESQLKVSKSYFSFNEEGCIKERILDDHLIYFLKNGSIKASINHKEVVVEPGSMLWIQPGVRNEIEMEKANLSILRFEVYGENERYRVKEEFALEDSAWELNAHMKAIIDENLIVMPFSDYRIKLWMGLIFSWIIRNRKHRSTEKPKGILNNRERKVLLDYVYEHIQEKLSPISLAEKMNYSADYFTRIFKRTFGMPPRKWILQERMRMAAHYLVDHHDSISKVAFKFGYDDVFLFSRQFKQVLGCSPRHYLQKR